VTIPLAIAISAAAAATAVTLLLVLRRRAPDHGFWGDREPNHSGSAVGVLGSGFLILIAFVLSLAFGGFQAAQHGAEQEAQATEALYQEAGRLPAAVGDPLRGTVVCYALAVARTDWGTAGDVAQQWPPAMATIEQRANLADPSQVRVLDHLDASDRDRAAGYVAREERSAPSVPAILWVAMIGGALLLVGYLCVFARPRTSTLLQAYMVAAIAAVGALNLCVIDFLDTPFSGAGGSIHPTAMQYSLAHMDAGPRALPCDAAGRPRPPGA
jgi:hypothetical protein